jgi:hypothetical protein
MATKSINKSTKTERRQLAGGFKRIVKYHKNTPAAAALPMIHPEMDALGGRHPGKGSPSFWKSLIASRTRRQAALFLLLK